MRLEFEQNLPTFPFAERESLEKISEESHPAIQAMLKNAIESAQSGDRVEARRKLLRVTEIEPRSETAWLWLASISEYPEELLIFLNNVLEINPENERALEWRQTTLALLSRTFVERGINAEESRQNAFARQCFYQAVAHDSNNETAWLRLAATSDSTEEKCAHLEKVMNINPNNEVAQTAFRESRGEMTHELLRKANSAAFADDFTTARTWLDKVLQNSPESEYAWLLKSFLTENFSDKIYCFEKILEINPRNETAHGNLNFLRLMKRSAAADAAADGKKTSLPPNDTESVEEFAPVINEPDAVTQEIGLPDGLSAENYFAESFSDEETPVAEFRDEEAPMPFAENSDARNFAEKVAQTESDFGMFDEDEREIFQIPESDQDVPAAEKFVSSEDSQEMLEMDFGSEAADADFAEDSEKENVEIIAGCADFDAMTDFSADFYHSPILENGETQNDFGERAEKEFFSAAIEMSAGEAEEETIFEETETTENFFLPAVSPSGEAEPQIFRADDLPVGDSSAPGSDFDFDRAETASEKNFSPREQVFGSAEDFTQEAERIGDTELTSESFAAAHANDFENHAADETDENQPPVILMDERDDFSAETNVFSCPFCDAENDVQDFSCEMCGAILSLSDLEMLLGNQNADREILTQTVNRMEEENSAQSFGEYELMFLGIGHLNLKNLRRGFSYLQQASQINPNNVLLSSQVNSLAIRLEEIERKEENSDGKPQSRTILVVDDSATVRKLIAGKLEKSGHEVVCAVDGMDALSKLEQIVPDLILLDITMPRMDGYQVCKMIRGNDSLKNIPVVMISGKDGFFDKVRGRMAGTTGYITKPFGPETLMKALDAYIKNDVSAPVAVDA